MPATEKQLEANRRNARMSTGPKTPEGKIRASLNAWRHGLTGQVMILPDEDRQAFETFCSAIRKAYKPEGPLELQIAQSIAEDEWRLNRARSIENSVLALGHHTMDAEMECRNTQIHAALTTARTFWRNPEKFALLSIYEQRISRKLLRNEERLKTLQAERKAEAAEAAKTPEPQVAQAPLKAAATPANGFAFSTPETTTSTEPYSASISRIRTLRPSTETRSSTSS